MFDSMFFLLFVFLSLSIGQSVGQLISDQVVILDLMTFLVCLSQISVMSQLFNHHGFLTLCGF